MNIFWTTFLVLLLFASLFGRCERDRLEKEVMSPARGVATLMVIFYHLALNSDGQKSLLIAFGSGPAAVALFFFLSGYGLIKQLGRRAYLKSFLTRSARKLFVPFLICMTGWWTYLIVIGQLDVVKMLDVFWRHGTPPSPNSWFLFELYLFYFFFWLSFKWLQGWRAVFVAVALTGGSFLAFIVCPWPCAWWLSSLAFPAGLIFATQEVWIVRNRKTAACVAAVTLAVLFVCSLGLNIHSAAYNFLRVLWYVLFAASCALVLYRFSIPSRALDYVGKISFELYLVHGCYILAFKGHCDQPILYVLSVIAVSVLTATGFHYGRQHLLSSKI